jgi:serine/threonine protein kinase
MFRKQDFKKVDLLGSGKKNTKIYKALHIPSGKYYALKEVEAKTLDKLNEYKVITFYDNHQYRKKPYSYLKHSLTRTSFSSLAISFMKPCTTLSGLELYVSILSTRPT